MGFLGSFGTRELTGVRFLATHTLAFAIATSACSGAVTHDGDESGGGTSARGGAGGVRPPGAQGGEAGGVDPGGPVVVSDLSSAPLSQMCAKATWGAARLWRLSRDQLRNSLKDALAVDLTASQLASFNDGAGLLFNNDAASLRIRKADAESWQLAAKDIAGAAVPAVKAANLCATLDAACAPKVVQFAANALFRRKLNDPEQTRYQKLYTLTLGGNGGTAEKATQAVLNAMLLSPYFLYRSELGTPVTGQTGVARLTPDEIATALAFTLWQTGPDAQLLQAAAAGKLNTTEDIKMQAQRMMGDSRFSRFYAGMLADLSHASRMGSREGADDVANASNVMKTLSEEFQTYAGGLTNNGATFAQLLTNTSFAIANDTAKFRNLGTATGSTVADVTLPSGLAGLLSLGAVNFANAGTDHPSPVKRGVMVRENFLCSPVPPPPPNVKQETVPRGGDVVTNRDVYEKTMAPSTCNACHRLFNPMGYAFEAFDEQGRYRTTDNGAPVKLSGEIVETRDANGTFNDLAGLAGLLSKSSQAQECFALNGFRFVSGRIESQGDLCHVSDIHAAWMAAKGDLKTLALLLVTSDAFVTRSTSL